MNFLKKLPFVGVDKQVEKAASIPANLDDDEIDFDDQASDGAVALGRSPTPNRSAARRGSSPQGGHQFADKGDRHTY